MAVFVLALVFATQARPQNYYGVGKSQNFVQTGSGTLVADSAAPWLFEAQSPTPGTVTIPGGAKFTMVYSFSDQNYSYQRSFVSKAALDAAFPNGTYFLSGPSFPTLTIQLTGDAYPAPPLLTVGAWNAGGSRIVRPGSPVTFSFNSFSGYATAGVLGHARAEFGSGFSDATFSKPIPAFNIVAAAQLTSLTIPAPALVNNSAPTGEISFETFTVLDPVGSNGAAGARYASTTIFPVTVIAAGAGGNPPEFTRQPADQSAVAGSRVTFPITVTSVGGFQGYYVWRHDGLFIATDGSDPRYSIAADGSLTITQVAAADAGNYAVRAINPGGMVTSAAGALTVTAAPPVAADSTLAVFGVSKQLNYEQTSAAAPSLPATNSAQFQFHLQANTAGSVRTPGGVTSAVAANAEFIQRYPNKAAMDTAFPDGTYTVSVGAKTGITLALASTYPSDVPRVTNGTWNAGKLVVDPSRDFTLQLNAFTDWGTTGALSIEYFSLWEGSGADIIAVRRFSSEQTTALGGVTIPAGKLVAGHTYNVETGRYSNGVIDRSSVAGALGFGGAAYQLTFQIVAAGVAQTAPTIVTAPESQSLAVGQSTVLTVGANGGGTYQWNKDGIPIANATSPTLALNSVQASAAGSYTVTVTNSLGSITSNAAIVMVSAGPGITLQPLTQNVVPGTRVVFNVAATGTNLTYQWKKNDAPIGGATDVSYVISSAQTSDMAFYACTVSDGIANTESATATLTVMAGPPARPINLSTRAAITPTEPLTAGVVLSVTKTLLFRASGPALVPFGVTGTLADPRVEIIPLGGSTPVATNNDWGLAANLPALTAAVTATGAFPFPAGSKDAAVLVTLPAGGYTARVTGADGGTGIALIEVYDADPATSAGQLINISARAVVGTGDGNLATGFVVAGVAPRLMLIRAVGPGLTGFGVSGVLADPRITVIPLGANYSIAGNDNWGGTAALKAAFIAAGAFGLDDASKDAAVLLRLPPGGYTAVVGGVGNTTGTAIVEVYDLGP